MYKPTVCRPRKVLVTSVGASGTNNWEKRFPTPRVQARGRMPNGPGVWSALSAKGPKPRCAAFCRSCDFGYFTSGAKRAALRGENYSRH